MSLNPDISVIVPVYNAEEYLALCLKSLISQTYKNFEVLLIDDGSQDGSCELIKKEIAGDDRFIIIHQNNMGSGKARNTGIKKARGDYLCFVDADDYVADNYLELLYKSIIQEDSDIAICRVQLSFADSSVINVPLASNKNHDWREALKDLLTVADSGCPCDKLYRRELFHSVQFPGGYYEDLEMLLSLFSVCQPSKISCVDEPLYIYIQHDSSKTHSISRQAIKDATESLDSIQDTLHSSGLWHEYGDLYPVLYIRRVNYVARMIALYSVNYFHDMSFLFSLVNSKYFSFIKINTLLLRHIRVTSFSRIVVINLLCLGVSGRWLYRLLFRLCYRDNRG